MGELLSSLQCVSFKVWIRINLQINIRKYLYESDKIFSSTFVGNDVKHIECLHIYLSTQAIGTYIIEINNICLRNNANTIFLIPKNI